MLLKLSFLVAASFAAFAVSRTKTLQLHLQDATFVESQELEEKDKENPNSDEEENDMMEIVREEEKLMTELEHRKVNIEGKLLELYGLKQEKLHLSRLKKQLEEKSAEIDILNHSVASLQSEKEALQEETKRGAFAAKKLQVAKKMIDETERKFAAETRVMKCRVSMIDERVTGFPFPLPVRDEVIEQKLKDARNVELEVGKTKRRNKELHLQNRALTVKLVDAQQKIASLSHITQPQDEVIDNVEGEKRALRYINEQLWREIEKVHTDRFEMLEQVVYQRWLNICLRFEARNKDNINVEKVKSPSCSLDSFSSMSSSTEIESTTLGSSSTESSCSTKSSSFIRRITKWRSSSRTKDDSIIGCLADKKRSKFALVRRFSASMVPERRSSMSSEDKGIDVNMSSREYNNKKKEVSDCNSVRVRRVSFSDDVLVRKVCDDTESDNEESINENGFEAGKGMNQIVNEEVIQCDGSKVKEQDQLQYLFLVLGFLLFIFIAYFLRVTTTFLIA